MAAASLRARVIVAPPNENDFQSRLGGMPGEVKPRAAARRADLVLKFTFSIS
jgi:hypothetical protein